MKYSLLLIALLSTSSLLSAFSLWGTEEPEPEYKAYTPVTTQNTTAIQPVVSKPEPVLTQKEPIKEPMVTQNQTVRVSVIGQGVSPMNTESPAQAYALAKRAAIADGYRIIAEKVKGVRVEGHDLIQNMMIKRSSIRTSVNAMVRNANIVETTFKDGLCEVEMEIVISYTDISL